MSFCIKNIMLASSAALAVRGVKAPFSAFGHCEVQVLALRVDRKRARDSRPGMAPAEKL
jgi:hypothetical protein